jgi:hypothetical protein
MRISAIRLDLTSVSDKICVETPSEFQESDWGEQVYATATRTFAAADAAGVFAAAQEWIARHKVYVLNLGWNHFRGEDHPYTLTVYFTFDDACLD